MKNNKISLNYLDNILFILFIILLTRNSFYYLISPLTSNILLLAVYIYFFYRLLTMIFLQKKRIYFSKLLLLTLILILLSSFWSFSTMDSLKKSILNLILPSMVMIYFINKYKLINVLISTAIAGTIIAISSYFTVFVFPQYGITSEGTYIGLWTGIFPNKNLLAVSITFHIIVALFLLFFTKRKSAKVLILLLIVMYFFLIIKASSTTSILIFITTILFTISIVYTFKLKNKYLFVSITVFYLLLVSVLITGFIFNIDNIVSMFNKDLTFSGRTKVWETVWSLVIQRPVFGYGYGMFWHPESSTFSYVQSLFELSHAHNGFLDIITNIGFVGLILLTLSMFIYLKINLSLILTMRNKKLLLPLMYFIVFVLYNLSESYFIEQNFFMWSFYFYFYHFLIINNKSKSNSTLGK